jgi:hypothetical protein
VSKPKNETETDENQNGDLHISADVGARHLIGGCRTGFLMLRFQAFTPFASKRLKKTSPAVSQ